MPEIVLMPIGFDWKEEKKTMKKFKVYAKQTNWLETEIEAESLEEAEKIADEELITADFDLMQGEFELEGLTEITE